MQSYETLSTERMSSDEAQRVAQLLSERLRDSITIDELANTMNVPRDQVAAALSQIRHGPAVRPNPSIWFDIDTKLLVAAAVCVVVVWTVFIRAFVAASPVTTSTGERIERTQPVPAPVADETSPPSIWATPASDAVPEVAVVPGRPAPEAPTFTR
ncbi:MAG: hypothetical protein H6534_02525 [Chthonomonadaceae bacterium]|nr:hypothetical protein [Chthonomonadaceae bacterium]